jgi:glycosyltransferase XagB
LEAVLPEKTRIPTPIAKGPSLALPGILSPEIAFLSGRHLELADLQQAEKLSRAWGTTAEQVLFATGQISERDYYQALAVHAGLNFTDLDRHPPDWGYFKRVAQRALGQGDIAPLGVGAGGLQIAYAPRGQAARRMARMADEPALGGRLRQNIFIATPGSIRNALLSRFRRVITQTSIDKLSRQKPEMSARYHLLPLQKIVLLGLLIASVGFLLWQPFTAYTAGNLILAAIFLAVTGFRLIAAFRSILRGFEAAERPRPGIPDRDLPVYTILVPLYKEANVLASLVCALKALDYPPAKLDIKLILEESDAETCKKARELDLPYAFDVIVVPNSTPQTKPKALNYAMQFARGEYVVIYDAEDRPDPDQLRKAVAAFSEGPDNLACVQARLGIYNPNQNWLTAQFTIEYAALFGILLPALEALGAPLPLGGTSNHFRGLR